MELKLKAPWQNYCWQFFLVGLFVFAVLLLFRNVVDTGLLWALGVSSLSSSAFIVFTNPNIESSRPTNILASYFINIAMGSISHYTITRFIPTHSLFSPGAFYVFAAVAAAAVLVSMVLMIFFNVKHPPAVGICLIFIIDLQSYFIVTVVAIAAVVLALLRVLLGKQLRNL